MITRAVKILGAGLFLAILASFTAYVFLQMQNTYAQTPTPAPEGAQAGIIILEVSPSKVLSVPKDKPQSLELEFRSLKSEAGERVVLPSGDVDVRDATFKGVVRYVLVGKRKVGQLVLTEVSSGRKTERLSANKYVYQWDLKKDVVGRADSFKVKAKRTELMAVFVSLTRKVGDAGAGGKRGEGATKGKTAASSGGDGGAGKSDATSYKPPTGGGKVPEIDVQISTDGCTVRVDMAQGVSIQQTKSITTEDGKVTDTSECGDSATRYKLVKSFACEDKVNQGTGIVQAQFKWYYDKEGTKVEVSECQADAERFFKITEETGECAVKIDLLAGTATPQTAKVYTNANNEKVQVRGCAASRKVASVSVEDTADGCAIRKVNGLDVQFTRKVYALDGTTYEARGCESGDGETVTRTTSGCVVRIDTDQLLAIQQSKTQNIKGGSVISEGSCEDTDTRYVLKRDYDVCSVSVDVDKREATEQYGHYYTISGRKVAVAGCETDDRNIYAVKEKVSTCSARVDVPSLKVYPKAILVYQDHKGVEVEVRGCDVATTIAAIAITSTEEGCVAVKDDTGLTRERERLVYVLSGETKQAQSCQDNGKSFWVQVDDCKLRTDTGAKKVFVQKRKIHFENGRETRKESCIDSEKSYALVINYETCSDVLDSPVKVGSYAYAQFETYYADDLGTKKALQACMKDTEKKYKVQEAFESCPMDTDIVKGEVTVQSTLVYFGKENLKTEASACKKSDSYTPNPILMTRDASLCALVHDFDAGYSKKAGVWTYTYKGGKWQGSGCLEFGNKIRHETVYQDGGRDICTPILDLDGSTLTLQFRKAVTVEGVKQYITPCRPDGSSLNILATTDGCSNPATWEHDLANNVSYGEDQHYYVRGGDKVYVTQCEKASARSYTHQHVTSGYQYNDPQLFDYPLVTVTIDTGSLAGVYTLQKSRVLPGASQLSYTKTATKDEKTGTKTYSGCTKSEVTQKFEHWQRSDASVYKKSIGRGTTVTSDVCKTQTKTPFTTLLVAYVPSRPDTYNCGRDGSGRCGNSHPSISYYETWKKTTKTNKDTLDIVTTSYTKVSGDTVPSGVSRSKSVADIKAGKYF